MWQIIFSSIWAFLKPVLIMLVQQASKEIMEMVLNTVQAMAATDLTNEEKRKEAFYQIKENLKAEGKELGSSMINLLIEIAVARLKQS